MKFTKMHGLGNDFVILDYRENPQTLSQEQITHICDRHRGVGCDQLIIMEHESTGPANGDVFMRIYNPDGSEAEACGNATRCVAHIIMTEQGSESCIIETVKGPLKCNMTGNHEVEVNMGAPISIQDTTVALLDQYDPVMVNMGNPHCVIFVEDVEKIDLPATGALIESHDMFPDRTNVEFVHIQKDGSLRTRVWERGAGVTLACGSGACAVGVAAIYRELTTHKVDIEMDGGHLHIEWQKDTNHVLMTGAVAYVFEGELNQI